MFRRSQTCGVLLERKSQARPTSIAVAKWEQFREPSNPTLPDDDPCARVGPVDLPNQFATAAARRENTRLADCDNDVDLRLSCLEHFRYGRVLSAKPETTSRVKADARIRLPGPSEQSRPDSTGHTVLARPKLADELSSDLN